MGQMGWLRSPLLQQQQIQPPLQRMPLRAAVDVGARLEPLDHQPLERVHGAVAASQFVVERQDLDDQPGAKAKRRSPFSSQMS